MADIANSKLLQEIEGIQQVKDALVVLVKTEWNAAIIDELERGCKNTLEVYGIASKNMQHPRHKRHQPSLPWPASSGVELRILITCASL
jgi:hypothetical protein